MPRADLASLLFLGNHLTPAHAQRDTTAPLTGTVRSSIHGLPVSGVMIAVKGSRVFNVSDSTGSFTLAGLPGGRQTVRILYGDSLSRSEEHTSELQSRGHLVCRLLLEKKNNKIYSFRYFCWRSSAFLSPWSCITPFMR